MGGKKQYKVRKDQVEIKKLNQEELEKHDIEGLKGMFAEDHANKIICLVEKEPYLTTKELVDMMAAKDQVKFFRGVENVCPIYDDIACIDLSLQARAIEEDMTYKVQPLIMKNLRRGNTLLKSSTDGSVVFGRKGLYKFFDLKYHFVSKEKRYFEDDLDP